MPPSLDYGSRRAASADFQSTRTQSATQQIEKPAGLFGRIGQGFSAGGSASFNKLREGFTGFRTILREFGSFPFQVLDKAEAASSRAIFGRRTNHWNTARLWTEKNVFNPILFLPDDTTSERSDFDEIGYNIGKTKEAWNKGDIGGVAGGAVGTAWWTAINVLDVFGVGKGVKGAAKSAKATRALSKISPQALTEIQSTAVRTAQKQARDTAVEKILTRQNKNSELLRIAGKAEEVDTITSSLEKLADRAVRTEVPERLVTETRRTATESRKLSGNYVEIPKQIDAVEIQRIEVPRTELAGMTGIEKGALNSYNALAESFNKISNSRAARAIQPYSPKEYKEFFTSHAERLRDAAKSLIDNPRALSANELKKIRLDLNVLKDAMKNDFNDFVIRTNLQEGIAAGLTATKRKNLIETLQKTAAREIETNFRNAFKIIGRRRTAAQLDADLISGKYTQKLQDLKDAGIPITIKKSALIGKAVEKAAKIKNAAQASQLLQSEIYKNYTKVVSGSLRPYLKTGILKSNAVPQSVKSGIIKSVNKEIAKFVKGDTTADQLNEILSVTLTKDGSSILNSSFQRRNDIETRVREMVHGRMVDGERVGGYDFNDKMLQPGITKESFRATEKNFKDAKKAFDKKVEELGIDKAQNTPEYVTFSKATDELSDALVLQNTDFGMVDQWKPRGIRLLFGGYTSAAKKIAQGRPAQALLHSMQTEAVQTSGIFRVFKQPSGGTHPVIADTLTNPLRAFDDAQIDARKVNNKYLYAIDPELKTYLRKNKMETTASLTKSGTLSYHAKYYSALLMENLTASKLKVDELGERAKDLTAEALNETAGALTKALTEHGVKDVSVTADTVKKYIDSIDHTSENTRIASKKLAMDVFRKEVLGMDAGVVKIFDDKVYPYIDEIGNFYQTKVKDGYTILYNKEAPTHYDFYFPLNAKEGRLVDDTEDLKFLDLQNVFIRDGTDTGAEELLRKPGALTERNAQLSDKAYALDGEKVYGRTVEKVYGFGNAAPHLYQSKRVLEEVGEKINKDVKDMITHNLAKMSGQRNFQETVLDGTIKWLAGLNAVKFLVTPQFAGGTYAARGIESLAGIGKAARKWRAPGNDLLKQNPDFSKRIREDIIPERYEDNINVARADLAMLERQVGTGQGNSIRGNIFSKDNLSQLRQVLDEGLGRKLLYRATSPERTMYEKVVAGSLLERFNKKVKQVNKDIPESAVVYPKNWEELVEVVGENFTTERNLLDEIYGAVSPARRSPVSVNADGFTAMAGVFTSWVNRSKQRLGTAFLNSKVRKAVGNKNASDLRLSYEDSQTTWDALSDIIESEAHYQFGRAIVRSLMLKAFGEDDENFTETFTRSVRDNLANNAVSIGWAGQQLSEPVLDMLRGYGFQMFDMITEPVADVAGARNLTDALAKGAENASFWGNFVLGDNSPVAPIRKLLERTAETDAADQYFRKEVGIKFKQTPSIEQGIQDALEFYRRGSEEAVPWHTVKQSSYKEEIAAKEEVLSQAQRFAYRSLAERAFGESEEDLQLGRIYPASGAIKDKNGVTRNLRSLYTLLIMPNSDWKALNGLAEDVVRGTGKTSHQSRLRSWRGFRGSDGTINTRNVETYVESMAKGIGLKSTGDARTDKQFFGDYEPYLEKIIGLVQE